jgi:hypothetical protein
MENQKATDQPQVRSYLHQRYGGIKGSINWEDNEWIEIKLEHSIQGRTVDYRKGEIVRLRKSFMLELTKVSITKH